MLIFLIVSVIISIVFFILWQFEKKKHEEYKASTIAELIETKRRIAGLEKYEAIIDVEKECRNLRETADKEAKDIIADAKMLHEQASVESKAILEKANTDAQAILEKSKARKQELDAQSKAYEAAILAYKNTIDGYGDEWLKPTYSLLDRLAEDFSYEDAGQKLAEARRNTTKMIRNGEAGTCDYVEAVRRKAAINSVVDAFNGKVDSILSRVRYDNYGKLEQQIKDAYSIININGQAFRNARITAPYLEQRLNELKWAVMCQELKVQKLEEQRRLREQMREEEKARREYERAQKEAAKEEAILHKAMEKAQAAMEQANADQRAELETQLADLQQKLAEAEAKNQRALSMAQQTKHGNVYVISNIGSFGENVYKVGMTRRLNPLDRVRELGDASVPFPFDVHAIIESDDAPALETSLHKALALMQVNKVNPRKEFFRVNLMDIHKLVNSMDLSTKWTMEADAAEYRETLAIEAAMQNDPAAKERWEAYNTALAAVDPSSFTDEDEIAV